MPDSKCPVTGEPCVLDKNLDNLQERLQTEEDQSLDHLNCFIAVRSLVNARRGREDRKFGLCFDGEIETSTKGTEETHCGFSPATSLADLLKDHAEEFGLTPLELGELSLFQRRGVYRYGR